MTKLKDVISWRVHGIFDRGGLPGPQYAHDRVKNRAKYEVWRYNTFGPGQHVFRKDDAYDIVDSGQLQEEPLYLNDPWDIAAMSSVIAEMDGHAYISLMVPHVMPRDENSALEKIAREQDEATAKAARFYKVEHDDLIDWLKRLVDYQKSKK